ncbi:hypothetical protein [Streptomyces sp. GESEQ-35]|uniref:hypothetical protein n=1 Tax=Streptomyces sp. GESEQ-35 TaxID=2812657 RepID=UPI001B320D5F|nr:hypothetical protein [Streptomyces sp. GESEQ-35]
MPRLQLIGAHITGRLQLQYATIEIPFSLVDCRFDAPVELDDASLRAADLTGCHIPRLSADRLRVDGDLTLNQLASGGVSLFGTQIRGDLWLNAARIAGGGSDCHHAAITCRPNASSGPAVSGRPAGEHRRDDRI